MSERSENDGFKLLDTVVSMNGFHAFPDKQKAFHEIWRVLKLFSTVSAGERAKKYPSRTI